MKVRILPNVPFINKGKGRFMYKVGTVLLKKANNTLYKIAEKKEEEWFALACLGKQSYTEYSGLKSIQENFLVALDSIDKHLSKERTISDSCSPKELNYDGYWEM